jgi:hypothetical protein
MVEIVFDWLCKPTFPVQHQSGVNATNYGRFAHLIFIKPLTENVLLSVAAFVAPQLHLFANVK